MNPIYWEVKAQGDTIYVRAQTFDECQRIIVDQMGEKVLPLCTFKVVSKLPAGEEAINAPTEEE